MHEQWHGSRTSIDRTGLTLAKWMGFTYRGHGWDLKILLKILRCTNWNTSVRSYNLAMSQHYFESYVIQKVLFLHIRLFKTIILQQKNSRESCIKIFLNTIQKHIRNKVIQQLCFGFEIISIGITSPPLLFFPVLPLVVWGMALFIFITFFVLLSLLFFTPPFLSTAFILWFLFHSISC